MYIHSGVALNVALHSHRLCLRIAIETEMMRDRNVSYQMSSENNGCYVNDRRCSRRLPYRVEVLAVVHWTIFNIVLVLVIGG